MAFFVSAKNRVSPNFAQPELAHLPNFLYLRASSQDIPKIMFKSYTSNDNLLLPPCLGDFIPRTGSFRGIKSPKHGGKSRLSLDV